MYNYEQWETTTTVFFSIAYKKSQMLNHGNIATEMPDINYNFIKD